MTEVPPEAAMFPPERYGRCGDTTKETTGASKENQRAVEPTTAPTVSAIRRLVASSLDEQLTVDELVQDVVRQASSVSEAVAVRAMDPKLRPEMVTQTPPDQTELGGMN